MTLDEGWSVDLIKLILIIALGIYILFVGFMGYAGIMEVRTTGILIGAATVFLVLNIIELRKRLYASKLNKELIKEEEELDKRVQQTADTILQIYAKKGIQHSESTIFEKAGWDEVDKIRPLLKKDPNILFQRDENGRTMLHYALESGNDPVAEFLISKGADINTPDNDNRTPLHCAVERCTRYTVELLISKGAKVNVLDNQGVAPLSFAMKLGKKDIESVLVKHGAFLRAQ